MTDHKTFAFAAFACALLVATPAALAQDAVEWQGQDSEFGKIRAPYTLVMEGERVPIETRVVLLENYVEKDSRFFMFAYTVEGKPLDVQFDSLIRTDTNAEMPCFKREGTSRDAIKCSVDLRDMPEPGVEIRMYGTVGADKNGLHQIGAMVIPFTYAWARVQMSNGLNAELYAGTNVNVQECTAKKCTIGGLQESRLPVPGVGAVGLVAVGVVALGIAAIRRKK